MFIAISSFLGVVEFFGPFFRHLISSWQSLTRGMWDYFIFSHLDIYVREADKDGLTFCLFLAIFGASLIPKVINIFKSDIENPEREVNWKAFPIAFTISSIITFLVISYIFHMDGSEKFKAFSFIFSIVIFLILYTIIGFFPIIVSYTISYSLKNVSKFRKNCFKEVYSVFLFLTSIYISVLLLSGTAFLDYFKATVYVTSVVVFFVLFIPLLMPIIQPEKLFKLAVFSCLICVVSYSSYTLEFFKQRSIAINDGYIKNINTAYAANMKNKVDTSCSSMMMKAKNDTFGAMIFGMVGMTDLDMYEFCLCSAKEIVKTQKVDLIEKLAIKSEFEKNIDYLSSQDIFDICRKN